MSNDNDDTETVFRDVVTVCTRRARLAKNVQTLVEDLAQDPLGSTDTDRKLADLQTAMAQPEVEDARRARGRLNKSFASAPVQESRA